MPVKQLFPTYLLFLGLGIFGSISCRSRKESLAASRPISTHYVKSNTSGYGVHTSLSAYNEDVQAYVKAYGQVAAAEMKKFGVPASIILAQGIHESRAGRSVLATVANNHFGIKCTSDWAGESFHMDDDRPNECFRKYSNPESSFTDHMLFLQRKHYESLFALGKTDYKGWAYGLKKCGYATNPRYAEILISMIERFQLDRFDLGSFQAGKDELATVKPLQKGGLVPSSSPEVRNGDAPKAVIAKKSNGTFVVSDTIHRKVYVTDTIYQYAYQKAISQARAQNARQIAQNGGDEGGAYTVRAGDTLYGICKRLNLDIEEMKKLNNLSEGGIKLGQVLKIPK